MAETFETELLVAGGIDTLCLLDARDGKIAVPFWGEYIPYGLREREPLLYPDWLQVERAEALGERAVRLFWHGEADQNMPEAADERVEEPFGVVTYNNSLERQYVTTPKTQDIVLDRDADPESKKWLATLSTESVLSDPEQEAFRRMLGKLCGHVVSRYNRGRL